MTVEQNDVEGVVWVTLITMFYGVILRIINPALPTKTEVELILDDACSVTTNHYI